LEENKRLLHMVSQEKLRRDQEQAKYSFSEQQQRELTHASSGGPFTGSILYTEFAGSSEPKEEIYDNSIDIDDGTLNCKTEFGEIGVENFLV